MTLPQNATELDGDQLLVCFQQAAARLRAAARRIDAINVYPVPDGDTGSNMAATLDEAVARVGAAPVPRSAALVLSEIARGALYGARGNSGVILSQALRGLATVESGERLTATALSDALGAAARLAYAAVGNPVEGTMLTVLGAAASGGRAADAATVYDILRAATTAAERAERLTPTQLPALAEAGVTDSGGEGICVILRGLMSAFETGETKAEAVDEAHAPLPMLAEHHEDDFGFCTEFLLEPSSGCALDVDAVRVMVAREPNRSVIVVGDSSVLRVHVHTAEPDELLSEASNFGRLSRVKVDNMDAQRERFGAGGSGASAKVAVLALSPGAGFDVLFENMGAHTLRLEPVAKPSAGDLARAADALRGPDALLLPNHGNVVLAARQAVELASCTLRVVATESLPQGIAAAFAFDAERTAAGNVEPMQEAAGRVTTVEVTVAAADRTADGVSVRAGQPIAIVDGQLVAAAETSRGALIAGLEAGGAATAGIVTLLGGAGLADGELERARDDVAGRFGVEVEAIDGGQELYAYIASVEP